MDANIFNPDYQGDKFRNVKKNVSPEVINAILAENAHIYAEPVDSENYAIYDDRPDSDTPMTCKILVGYYNINTMNGMFTPEFAERFLKNIN